MNVCVVIYSTAISTSLSLLTDYISLVAIVILSLFSYCHKLHELIAIRLTY